MDGEGYWPQQKTLFGNARDGTLRTLRREAVIIRVIAAIKDDKGLLALLRAEDYGERVIADAVPRTPATRARPKGEVAVQEGRAAGAALFDAVVATAVAVGAQKNESEDVAEVVLARLQTHIAAEREGGRHGGIRSGVVRRAPRSPEILGRSQTQSCPQEQAKKQVEAEKENADLDALEGPSNEDLARLAREDKCSVGDLALSLADLAGQSQEYDDGWGR